MPQHSPPEVRPVHLLIRRAKTLAPGMSALALAACGANSSPPATQATGPVGTIHVVMKNISFNPPVLHAKVGQTVTWTNHDDAPHNVTHVSGPNFAPAPTFTNGHSFTLRLTRPGTITYRCTIHPGMRATILVAP
jgi:plastocyanin